jgi:hypothetical protein
MDQYENKFLWIVSNYIDVKACLFKPCDNPGIFGFAKSLHTEADV